MTNHGLYCPECGALMVADPAVGIDYGSAYEFGGKHPRAELITIARAQAIVAERRAQRRVGGVCPVETA